MESENPKLGRMQEILAEINKRLKTNFTFADDASFEIRRLPTGMPLLDSILGGGLPRKGITILYGYQSSGKTFIAQKVIANAQKLGMTCAFVDAEFAYDPKWAAAIGVDNSKLILIQPPTAEKALDAVITLCELGVDLVIEDSIAALLPSKEDELDLDGSSPPMGLHARLMNAFFRKVAPSNINTAIILINQVRAGLGGRGGYVPDVLPGGKGQQFFTRILLRLKKGEEIYNEGESKKAKSLPVGFYIQVTAEKNKTYQPLLTCEIPFYYVGATDYLFEIFQVALRLGIIEARGPYYSFGEDKRLGRDGFLEWLRADNDAREKLLNMIEEKQE